MGRPYTTSDPISDCLTATSVVLQSSGRRANTMILGENGYRSLLNHPNILDRIKYTSRVNTGDMLSGVLGIDNILVGASVYNTADEGGTESMSFVWGADALIAYISPSNNMRTASAVKTFVKSGTGSPISVKKYRDDAREGEFIEVNSHWKTIVTGSQAGYLIRGID